MHSENSSRKYNYPSFRMKKRDSDTYSATSGTSKSSGGGATGGRKNPRLSLQRLFFRPSYMARAATRSAREVTGRSRGRSELESRSVPSLPSSAATSSGAGAGAGASSGAVGGASSSVGPISESIVTVDNDSLSSASASTGACSSSSSSSSHSTRIRECPLCLAQLTSDCFPVIHTCAHRSCRDCLRQYLRIEITESRVNIACPECAERFHPNDIQAILDEPALMDKYELFMLRRVMVLDPDTRWCPAPDCTYAVIATGCASCPKLHCERPGCDTWFCYHCKQYWHPNQTCDAARAERNMRSSSISYSHESSSHSDIKPCPRCSAFIIKMDDGSCNHMTCAVCGAEFCWLCMKEISDLHYLSPSGCTFWGRKPWSRKKKILWQLGTLVGAPVGIGLVAGIAVPAMIIGIPVWVGKKLRAKYSHTSKHKRNLIITGGVSASILISPVLAGLAVGIGVPILLAYVYGVVPVSLCRSGGCGVTTTHSGGVRFEFDEDNDVTVGVSGPYSVEDVTSPAGCGGIGPAAGNRVANPSIGPSIGEMSLAAGSLYSHPGGMVDNDSTRAIAPASLDGASVASGYQTNRLEVHVDVATEESQSNKRASLSSESANFSLDAKSGVVSFGEDTASTKALAGSLCTRDRDNNSAVVDVLSRDYSVGGMASAACSISTTGGGTGDTMRPGSPSSNRSVTFGVLDCAGGGVRHKRYKRQSVSIGDSIHEQVSEDMTPVEGSGGRSGGGGVSHSTSINMSTTSSSSSTSSSRTSTSSTNQPTGVAVSSSEATLPHCPFPQLDETMGLPPFREDTYQSASELHHHQRHRHSAMMNSVSCGTDMLDKKRSLSMNDSHCSSNTQGGTCSGGKKINKDGGKVISNAANTNLSCLTP